MQAKMAKVASASGPHFGGTPAGRQPPPGAAAPGQSPAAALALRLGGAAQPWQPPAALWAAEPPAGSRGAGGAGMWRQQPAAAAAWPEGSLDAVQPAWQGAAPSGAKRPAASAWQVVVWTLGVGPGRGLGAVGPRCAACGDPPANLQLDDSMQLLTR